MPKNSVAVGDGFSSLLGKNGWVVVRAVASSYCGRMVSSIASNAVEEIECVRGEVVHLTGEEIGVLTNCVAVIVDPVRVVDGRACVVVRTVGSSDGGCMMSWDESIMTGEI